MCGRQCSSGGTVPSFILLSKGRSEAVLSLTFDEIHIRVLTNEHMDVDMLWTIFVVLLVLWLLGFSLHVGGGLIHLLLVVGLIILVFNLVSGRRGVV
jgi:hypothetical protein